MDSPLRELQPNVAAQPVAEAPTKPGLSVHSLPIGAPTPNPFDDRPIGKGPPTARKKRAADSDAIAAPAVNIEDMPVGGGSAQPMDEYPPGYTPPEDDSSSIASLPLEKRLLSKRWQERKSGYDELIAEAETAPDAVRAAHEDALSKMVADSNPFAQERALELLVVLARAISRPDDASRLAGSVMCTLCEKALPGRPNVKGRASEAALLLVEAGAALSVQAACVSMGSHKVPKVVLAALELLQLVICEFGPSVLELRGLIKPLGALGEGHKDKGVRDAALLCLVELRARAGESVVAPAFKDTKPACVAEYERLCAERAASEGRPPPARNVRGAPAAAATRPATGAQDKSGAAAGAGEPLAAFASVAEEEEEEIVEVAVLAKLPKGWAAKLASAKWQERKDALDALIAGLTGVRRLAKKEAADVVDLVRTLKRIVGTDANVNVVGAAVRAVGLFARAMGADFARFAKELCPGLLEKSAEKNRAVGDAVSTALDQIAMCGAATMADVAEWAGGGLGSKAPAVRLAAADWLRRCAVAPAGGALGAPAARAFVAALLKVTDDSVSEVRSAAYSAIAAAIAATPHDAKTDALLSGLDGTKRKALDKALAAAGGVGGAAGAQQPEVGSGGGGEKPILSRAASAGTSLGATARAPSTASSARGGGGAAKPKPLGRAASAGGGLSATMPARSGEGGSNATGGGSGGGGGNGGSSKRVTEADLDASDHALLGEAEVEARVRELVPGSDGVLERLRAKAWKDRLDAVDSLAAALCASEAPAIARDGATVDGVVALLGRSPGWKEPMVAVSARVAAAIGALARAAGAGLERATVAKAAPPLGERLADPKLRAPAADSLMALAEAAGVALVGAFVCRGARAHKNPKVTLEAAAWLRAAALGFGAAGGAAGIARAHGVVDFLAEAVGHRDAKVREAGVGAAVAVQLVALAAKAPPLLKALEPLLSAQHAGALTAALERAAAEPLPAPTICPVGMSLDALQAAASGPQQPASVGGATAGARGALPTSAPLEPLAQRVSLTAGLPPSVLTEMGSATWKAKLKAVAAAHDALRGLGPGVKVDAQLGPLAELLRARLADTNRTVAAAAADLCGELVGAIGRPSLPHVKQWAPPLLALLADARPASREAASGALARIVCEVSFEPLLPFAKTALSSDSGRVHVLCLLARFVPAVRADSNSAAELRALLPAVLSALASERGEGRAHAEALTRALCRALGGGVLEGALGELKTAEAAIAAPIVRSILAEPEGAQAAGVGRAGGECVGEEGEDVAGGVTAFPSDDGAAVGALGASAAAGDASKEDEEEAVEAGCTALGADEEDEAAAEELAAQAAEKAGARAPYLGLSAPAPSAARPATAGARAPPPAARAGSAGGSRPATAGGAQPTKARATTESAASSSALLACNKGKEGRARKEARVRWVHAAEGVPSAEAIEQLREQFGAVANGSLVAQLFAADFREHLGALAALERELDGAVDAASAAGAPPGAVSDGPFGQNLDLLVRWLALRLGGSANAAVVLRCAALLDKLLGALGGEGYALTELESRALLPALTAQLGANAEATRIRFRALVRGACGVAPPATVGTQLAEDLATSRNAKARVECAEMLAWLAAEHGLAAAAPARTLPLAVTLVSAPDKRLRAAAAHLLKSAHEADQLPGEVLCDRSLTSKLKLAPARAQPQPQPEPEEVAPPTPPREPTPVQRPATADAKAHTATARSQSNAPPSVPPSRLVGPGAFSRAQPAVTAPPAPPAEPAALAAKPAPAPGVAATAAATAAHETSTAAASATATTTAAISASPLLAPSGGAAQPARPGAEPASRLPALACALYGHGGQDESARVAALRELVSAMEQSAAAELRAHADSLLDAMLACLRAALRLGSAAGAAGCAAGASTPDWEGAAASPASVAPGGAAVSARWCKHILNAIMVLVKVPGSVRALSDGAARCAVRTLLVCMIDVHAHESDIPEGAKMLKALNLLVLRVLDELPRTRLATTLLSLLADSAPAHSAPATGEAGGGAAGTPASGGRADLCALVLKSLDKATAALSAAEPASAAEADLEPRIVLTGVIGFLRAHYALGDDAASPAASPQGSLTSSPRRGGGGSLGRRAREAVRALALQAMRIGGLSVEEAVGGMGSTDAFLLRRCVQQADGAPPASASLLRAVGRGSAARASAPPPSAEHRAAEPPRTPLAQALVDAVAHHAVGAPPSSARLTRSMARARKPQPASARRERAAEEGEGAPAAPDAATSGEQMKAASATIGEASLGSPAAAAEPTAMGSPAATLAQSPRGAAAAAGAHNAPVDAIKTEAEADSSGVPPGAVDGGDAVSSDAADVVRLALAASASAAESARARVERIRELRSRYPGTVPAPSAVGAPSARAPEPAEAGVAPSPGELTGKCMQRLRELKSKYQLSDSDKAAAAAAGLISTAPASAAADADAPTPSHSSMIALRERLARIKSEAGVNGALSSAAATAQ